MLEEKQTKFEVREIILFLSICFLMSCYSQRDINKHAVSFETITDKEWITIELNNKKIELSDTNQFPILKLSEGKVSGYSSCNRMQGTYTLEKEKIIFSPFAVTKMLCFETQDIEAEYLTLLSKVKYWEHKNGKLYFLNENKQIIITFEEKR